MASRNGKNASKKGTSKNICMSWQELFAKSADVVLSLFDAYGDRIWVNQRKDGKYAAFCLSTHQVEMTDPKDGVKKIHDIGKLQPSTIYKVGDHIDALCENGQAKLILAGDRAWVQAKKGLRFHAVGHMTDDGYYNVDSFKVEPMPDEKKA
jgi:hypothetical protein